MWASFIAIHFATSKDTLLFPRETLASPGSCESNSGDTGGDPSHLLGAQLSASLLPEHELDHPDRGSHQRKKQWWWLNTPEPGTPGRVTQRYMSFPGIQSCSEGVSLTVRSKFHDNERFAGALPFPVLLHSFFAGVSWNYFM